MHPRDVPQQCLVDVLLGLRFGAADALQPQADHLVSHFHGMCVETAGHERMSDQVGMRPHVAGARLRWPLINRVRTETGGELSSTDGGNKAGQPRLPRRGRCADSTCTLCAGLEACPREISTGGGADRVTATVLGTHRT